MSKTYSITSTSRFNKTGSSRSTVLNYTEDVGGTAPSIGYRNSKHQAFSFFFETDAMTHLASLPSSAITSISIAIQSSSGTNAFTTYGGAKADTGTTNTKITTSKQISVNSGSSKSLNLMSIGIPSTRAYSLGSYAGNTSAYFTPSSADVVLTVVTTENDFTLTYDANGGSGAPSSQTITSIDEATFTVSAAEPTRTGYTFQGWSISSSATTASYHGGDSITITANKTLYAVWSIIQYDIEFKPGAQSGVSGHMYALVKNYGVTVYLLNISNTDIVRTGYHATGWTTTDGGAQEYSFGYKYTTNAALTLYPAWVANTYTVSFDSAGGSSCESITVTYGEAYGTLPTPTRDGYTFNGWSEDGTAPYVDPEDIYSLTDDEQLIASWTANTYTVTYTDGQTSTTQTITSGTPWTVASYSYTKTGYTQTAWVSGATEYYEGDEESVWADLTLNPKWTANTYTVSFDAQGGSSCASITVTYDSTYGTLPVPTRAGYRFDGWFTDPDTGTQVTAGTSVAITADQTLYAHWTQEISTHYYNSNAWIKTADGFLPCTICGGQVRYRFTDDGED